MLYSACFYSCKNKNHDAQAGNAAANPLASTLVACRETYSLNWKMMMCGSLGDVTKAIISIPDGEILGACYTSSKMLGCGSDQGNEDMWALKFRADDSKNWDKLLRALGTSLLF